MVERVDALGERVGSLENVTAELAEALVVPRVRRVVEGCLPATTAFLLIHRFDSETRQCSAVPVPTSAGLHVAGYPPPPLGQSTHFFTSAHCFFNETAEWKRTSNRCELVISGNIPDIYQCALHSRLAHFSAPHAPLDLALIVCSTPVPMPPAAISTRLLLSHETVALAGFSIGAHVDRSHMVSTHKVSGNVSAEYSRHVHFTHLKSSMTMQRDTSGAEGWGATGGVSVGAASEASGHWEGQGASADQGFVGHSPEEGLSGGAVLDTGCAVVGIIERGSLGSPSGRFVRLTERVLGLMRDALCWGAGSAAC